MRATTEEHSAEQRQAFPVHEDRKLADRILSGDRRAFDDFFESNYPGLYRFALARLDGDDQLARDVAQTSIVKAIANLASYRGEASLKAWLYTICRHEVFAAYRRKQRAPAALDVADEENDELNAVLDSLPSGLDSPDEALRRREVVDLVHTVLDRLPGRYGDVLEWKYLQGVPVREIAGRLEVSPKAAESMLSRARAAFREAFETRQRVPLKSLTPHWSPA